MTMAVICKLTSSHVTVINKNKKGQVLNWQIQVHILWEGGCGILAQAI